MFFLIASGCSSAAPTPTPFRLFQGPTIVLPTLQATVPPTPSSTLVMSNLWTPTPAPTATPLPEEMFGIVARVLDAKTVAVVLTGDPPEKVYTVRLLGVDPPPNTPADPWGVVAFEQLQDWLSGQVVRLVQDKTVVDGDGVLPRYLYLHGELINLRLVEQGLARVSFQGPDTTLETDFQAAARAAQAGQRGLWGSSPTPTSRLAPTTVLTPPLTPTVTPALTLTATSTITTSRP
jgi:endonuclease YncB( thermonuclease family)